MKRQDVLFLDVEDIERFHDEALSKDGGLAGTRDHGLLESAVMAPQHGYYSTLAELASVYAHGIAKNHAFIDGNKRAAYLAAIVFLELNGYVVDLSGAEWIAIMNDVAAGVMTRDELADRLARALPGGGPVYIEGDT